MDNYIYNISTIQNKKMDDPYKIGVVVEAIMKIHITRLSGTILPLKFGMWEILLKRNI
jgi:hypothetical protein